MDDLHFDTLTRNLVAAFSRRWVLGGVASAISTGGLLTGAGSTAAKKKRRRKHKHKHTRNPEPPEPPPPPPPDECPEGLEACYAQCRLPEGYSCSFHAECCSNHCVMGAGCYPSCRGKACLGEADCCEGVPCLAGFCGACRGPTWACSGSQSCCYSECNGGYCQSRAGERCASRIDCEGQSDCVDGKCTCPNECCADTDCAPAEHCVAGECQPNTGG